MSYSRWSNSIWYTFWHSCGCPDELNEDGLIDNCKCDPILCVDCEFYFTYTELKEDMQKCIESVKKQYKEDLKDYDDEAYKELESYMIKFIAHVEQTKEMENGKKV